MRYKTILSLDPSGNFHEGKGTTGWCVYDCEIHQVLKTGVISAKDYKSIHEYHQAHEDLIGEAIDCDPLIGLVIEDYILYENKALSQTNSKMETPKLIGLIEHTCYHEEIPVHLQTASEVKTRWTDEILVHEGLIIPKGRSYCIPNEPGKKINRHVKDSIRHAAHFGMFKNKVKEG